MISIITAFASIMTYFIDKETLALFIVKIVIVMKILLFSLVILLSIHLAKELKGSKEVENIEDLINDIINGKLKTHREISKKYLHIRL
jgi:hypothetical protein